MIGAALLAATWISGVNPELHTYNREGECGTGAVVPWAGSLWAISYAPHMPNRSTDKLYEIRPDFTKVVRKESIGGTPANRLIHDESNQLFIGPYAIDAKGGVRVMDTINADGSTNLYGRLTASAVITDDNGSRWRFPYATKEARSGRLCRECCTERDLLNLAGVIYELPAENAGGYAKIRAVATPGEWMYDYCTWRGLFVISGIVPEGDFGRIVKSDDGKAQLWVGVADDLWKFGKPSGVGGPWKESEVRKGVPSDPYVMTGFDEKFLSVSSDNGANVTVELDITGTGTWIPFRTLKSADRLNISDVRAYWLRAVADRDCKATVQLEYK